MAAPNLFVDTRSGVLVRIDSMNESYVQITIIGQALPGHYSMLRADYDTTFIDNYRPATAEDIMRHEADIEWPGRA